MGRNPSRRSSLQKGDHQDGGIQPVVREMTGSADTCGLWRIVEATGPTMLEQAAEVLRGFPPHQKRRYAAHRDVLDRYFDEAVYAEELADLSAHYGPPGGCVLLALDGGTPVGAVCLRRMDHGACEMKRLFVPEERRGKGVAKALVNALIEAARSRGYTVMRLDTGSFMTEPLTLYERFGFVRRAPYYPVDPLLAEGFVFMERTL